MPVTNLASLGFSKQRLARINTVMQRYVDEGKFAGIVTLIARAGKTVHLNATGKRELESGTPMKTDTLFRIFSMTKPITTTAAMMLYEEGAFRLDDPVSVYLPAFAKTQVCVGTSYQGPQLAAPKRPMTIQQLMTHTSGLSYGWWQDSPVDALYRAAAPKYQRDDLTLAEFVDGLAELPLAFEPGTAWRYSYATDVLGRVVEVVSGQSLRQFFQERIFKPLGMRDTDYQLKAKDLTRFAAAYGPNPAGGLMLIDPPVDSFYLRRKQLFHGGHGLVSSAEDYLRFCQMILNKGELDGVRVLGRKTVEFMGLNHLPPDLPVRNEFPLSAQGFGLGFSVLVNPALSGEIGSAGTLGWGGAANTNFWIDPQEQLIGILMTQFMPSDTYPVVKDFHALAYQAIGV
jgi:CubicO group peptidase (beta-lactamase class C family)